MNKKNFKSKLKDYKINNSMIQITKRSKSLNLKLGKKKKN
jgi:hypothetical protein